MSLQYKEYGNDNAPLMLLLHGGGVSGWMWDKQVQYFSRYHCIVPDLPGHGVSLENPSLFNQMVENWINKDIISNKDIIVI
ncbi:alpha/beta hydrolase [Bacillus sp. JJ864]|uniref:alpha/beta fold hydrolase n=1 Tax=Bacillus sp. JJ864 TaxID=3122975 RepID=UPI003000E22A